MDASYWSDYICTTFADVETSQAYGYTFFFYRSDHMLPFATLASSDNEHDRVSQLDRPGVFRLNIGVSRATFQGLFGAGPLDTGSYDYTALDTLMPHPDYAPQAFLCVLNPDTTAPQVQQLLAEAHELAARRFQRRNPA